MGELMKNSGYKIWFLSVLVICMVNNMGFAADSLPDKVSVILDTDIGDDIDDTWALAMLLKSPELDVKLITTTFGKTEYRAKLVAKILTIAGRSDIPVGMGAGGSKGSGGQEAWVKDYDLKNYAGKIHEDGVQAMINEINTSSQPITLISIGPSTTVAEALKRHPEIAPKAVFVGMQGSVRKGYNGGVVCSEWNVKADISAAQKALLAPWKQTIITPLDTCGLIRLKGDRFKTLRDSKDVLVKTLMENYRIWAKKATVDELKESSILFDTVAIYLAYPGSKSLLTMEELSIGVTKEGITNIDPAGMKMSVATEWKDLGEYENLLIKRLTSTPIPMGSGNSR
jgi:inosine-uridine nucleoside N-ribohydrolase